ncbi:MAG: glucose-6-phosphate isomerase [Verrucomicrobia bacterium]|nr:glucose-6-phosphate isomerase [Verrucomicrobiota bacterium]
MTRSREEQWKRFQQYYVEFPTIELAMDISRMNFADDYFVSMEPRMQKAFRAMADLEKGAIANPDENRMVGHYWLRNTALAPTPLIAREIETTLEAIKAFAAQVHAGTIQGAKGPFKNLLLIGIGGSALGPQFVSDALGQPSKDKLTIHFLDNTDPDGMDKLFSGITPLLGQTMCIVISKSGTTKETRNSMLETQNVYQRAGHSFEEHAVAITRLGSELDNLAITKNWLKRFPMWDWVGGRTSQFSAVGLLPAALQGIDIDKFVSGARCCDELTRQPNFDQNPAAMLALMWFYIGNGKGDKIMVVLPYKDRLQLLSRYLQQLIMESLGKELDLDGKRVNQGIVVFGNKGSTDQHAYVQQLRDGIDNSFVTFIEVLKDRSSPSIMLDNNITSGDYLVSFLHGTRNALSEKGRESITLSLRRVSSFTVGVLIALFERTVSLYASLINVNAYNQPGVEAGKTAAASFIELQSKVLAFFLARCGSAFTAVQVTEEIGSFCEYETVLKICEHLSANPDRGLKKNAGRNPFQATYQLV